MSVERKTLLHLRLEKQKVGVPSDPDYVEFYLYRLKDSGRHYYDVDWFFGHFEDGFSDEMSSNSRKSKDVNNAYKKLRKWFKNYDPVNTDDLYKIVDGFILHLDGLMEKEPHVIAMAVMYFNRRMDFLLPSKTI